MKKNLFYVTSLTLGLALASCQNDVNEPILMDEVQNELATTRADTESPVDDEIVEQYAVGPSISGPSIITGTGYNTYQVTPPWNSVKTVWSYNTGIFNLGAENNTTLMISLKDATTTADVMVTATFYDSSDNVISQSRIYTGVNGPHYNHCSIRVIRSSDGAEVYPTHTVYMEPNTYYYAYFSTTTGGNMNLTWTFYDNDVYKLSEYGNTLYFKTGDIDNCFLHVDGSLAGSSIVKSLLGIVLY